MFWHHKDSELRSALDASIAVIEFSTLGEILTANANFLSTTGYELNEIVGRHHRMFCDPNYVGTESYTAFWQHLAAGRFQSGEFKRVHKNGSVLWLQASYNPIRDRAGRIIRIIKFAQNVTSQKSTAIDHNGKVQALEISQAVIEFTPKGEILTANANFLSALGYELAEITGRHHSIFCDPTYAASKNYADFWTALQRGEFQAAEYKRIAKGGREVYIQATYNPIVDDTGTVIKVVKFATDTTASVTRRLNNESLSRDINTDLGNVVEQVVGATQMATSASTASTETGSIVHSVAAASEELSASVSEIAQNMSQARARVEDVFDHAEKANLSAERLHDSAEAMNNIVSIIQAIASQINLLALNATIESARAGEAGRGFAVVATEVKNLAKQAAQSTGTIKDEIGRIQDVTAEVVGSLRSISNNMTVALENVTSVATAIEEQHAVTGEISSNMQAAVTAVQAIDQSLSEISFVFGSVADASEQVKRDVERLVEQ